MEMSKYTLHRLAGMALHQLSNDDQAAVRDKLGALGAVPLSEWPAAGAQKMPAEPSLYLLRVNESLRVILRAVAGHPPEVLDIIRHETLEAFANAGT